MRIHKKLISILILLSISMNIFSATSLPDYEPYGENEFPSWAKKLRRAEIITLGATAFTYPIMGLFVKIDDNSMSGFWTKFGISAAAGACIALVDYILGETSQKKPAEKKEPILNLSPNSKEAHALDELKQNFTELQFVQSELEKDPELNLDELDSELERESYSDLDFEPESDSDVDIELDLEPEPISEFNSELDVL